MCSFRFISALLLLLLVSPPTNVAASNWETQVSSTGAGDRRSTKNLTKSLRKQKRDSRQPGILFGFLAGSGAGAAILAGSIANINDYNSCFDCKDNFASMMGIGLSSMILLPTLGGITGARISENKNGYTNTLPKGKSGFTLRRARWFGLATGFIASAAFSFARGFRYPDRYCGRSNSDCDGGEFIGLYGGGLTGLSVSVSFVGLGLGDMSWKLRNGDLDGE